MKYCTNCGTSLFNSDKFCSSCGKRQRKPRERTPASTSTALAEQHTNKQRQKQILTSSLLLLIAILCLALTFMPLFSGEQLWSGSDYNFTIPFKRSLTDIWEMANLSRNQISYEEYIDQVLDLWKRVSSECSFIVGLYDYQDLTKEEQTIIKEYQWESTKLSLQYQENSNSYILIAATVGFAYLLVNIAFLASAIFHFIDTFTTKRCRLNTCTQGLLLASVASLLLFCFATKYHASSFQLSGISIVVLLLSLGVTAYLILQRFLEEKPPKGSFRLVPTIISAVSALVLLFSLTLPIMSTSVRVGNADDQDSVFEVKTDIPFSFYTTFSAVTEETYSTFEDLRNTTAEEKRDDFKALVSTIQSHSGDESQEQMRISYTMQVITKLIIMKCNYSSIRTLAYEGVFGILAFTSALVVLWSVCFQLLTGKSHKKLSICGKTATLLFSVLTFVLVFGAYLNLNGAISTYVPDAYRLSISIGIFLVLASAITLFCTPSAMMHQSFTPITAPVAETAEEFPTEEPSEASQTEKVPQASTSISPKPCEADLSKESCS